MADLLPVQRALLSVSDKTDITTFARALADRGVEILSTGGTARALQEAGIPVVGIEDVTGFPEIMDGRVKTLHPKVHGALLAVREDAAHQEAMREHDITPIDLVCVNLYPFERTISDPDVAERDAVEQIDIGGPSMLRSAAKNFDSVTVVTSHKQYDRVIAEMDAHSKATSRTLRAEFAAAAFARTSEYDTAIASYLGRRLSPPFPQVLQSRHVKIDDLRYGENPHQEAALYRDPASTGPTVVNAEQLHGKQLSYNNLNDAASALELVKDLRRLGDDRVGAAVIKHANPCGGAVAPNCAAAVRGAMQGDPTAAFGGILAVNTPFSTEAAQWLVDQQAFLEVILAPSFAPEALELLSNRWTNARLLAFGDRGGSPTRKLEYRTIPGGMLVQDRDTRNAATDQWKCAAGPAPSADRLAQAAAVWTFVKHLRSNAICIGRESEPGVVTLVGAGMGLVDRVTACHLAVQKAGERASEAIAASDAFFPFPDGPQALIDAGVTTIVQPGGSKRDQETFDLCEKTGVTCLLTGVRHFRH